MTNFTLLNFLVTSSYTASHATLSWTFPAVTSTPRTDRGRKNPGASVYKIHRQAGQIQAVGVHLRSSERHLYLPAGRDLSTHNFFKGLFSSFCNMKAISNQFLKLDLFFIFYNLYHNILVFIGNYRILVKCHKDFTSSPPINIIFF